MDVPQVGLVWVKVLCTLNARSLGLGLRAWGLELGFKRA